jgi:hypothetical protein
MNNIALTMVTQHYDKVVICQKFKVLNFSNLPSPNVKDWSYYTNYFDVIDISHSNQSDWLSASLNKFVKF